MQSHTQAIASRNTDVYQQFSELVTLVRRRPGLISTCLLVAGVLGALYYLNAPRTYESSAEMLFVTKHYSLNGREDGDSPIYEKSMETHAEMLCKPLIVGRAVQDFNLRQLPTLASLEDDEVVPAIIDNLTAHLETENSTIVQLTYRSSDPVDAQKITDAIATTYRNYLKEDNESVGMETIALFRDANENLLTQLSRNQEEHRQFQKNAPLMWREGRGVNIHHERQATIEEDRQRLMNERTVVTARLDTLKKLIKSGVTSREALKYEALQALSLSQEDTSWRAFQMAERQQLAEREAVRGLSSTLVGEYVRLKVQESEYLDEFGEGHPQVESTRKRMDEIKVMLDKIFQNQSELGISLVDTSDAAVTDDTDYVRIYLQKLQDELVVLDSQIAAFDREFTKEQVLANKMQDYLLKDQAFRNDHDNTQRLFDVVVANLKQVDAVRIFGGDTMTIVAPATLGKQVAPRILLVLFGSAMLGLIGGLSLAMSRERSEDMFRSVSEIRQTLGVPVIGRIPLLDAPTLDESSEFHDFDPMIVTLHDELTPGAEAFRGVRTNLFFSTAGQHRVIQVTSPLPGDGKSTVTANLAVAIAKSGKRVLVLDADFRRPALTQLLGEPETDHIGLAGILAGTTSLESAVVPTKVENLFFLPVCQRPTQPSELLSTPEFKKLIEEAREKYDLVLIDTPPVIPVTDPCVVAARVDGVILTLRIRRGVQEAAMRAMESLRDIDANVMGVVVNGWQPQFPGERVVYGYGYGYDYRNGHRNGHAHDGVEPEDLANGKERHWLGQLIARR